MKKYEWLREDALGKTITEEDCVRLGRNPYHWRNFLDGCVLEKVVNEDDAISLREFLDRWGHKSRYILLSICTIISSHLCERVLIDSGYEDPSKYTVSYKAKKFIESRNLARLAAMLTLRGMRKTPLLRDVAPMVARLIWGSRGYYTQKCADAYYLDLMK